MLNCSYNLVLKLQNPKIKSFGDNKLADNVFGLFAPDRYQIEDYDGYRVDILQDHFRVLSILKSRDGEANVKTPLFFDGATNYFKEMPRMENIAEVEKVYGYVQNL